MDHALIEKALRDAALSLPFGAASIIRNESQGLGICGGFAYHVPSSKVLVLSEISSGAWANQLLASDPEGVQEGGLAGEVSYDIPNRVYWQDSDQHVFRQGPVFTYGDEGCVLFISTKTHRYYLVPPAALEDGTFTQMPRITARPGTAGT